MCTTTYEQYDSLSAFNGSTSKTTIARIPIFPSSAIGINSSNGKTYLYTAWMDGNLTDGSLDGTFGIYTLEYNLSDGTPIGNSSDYGPVAQISGIHDEWMPSLTLSPDGSHAFIGFYGGNGFYYSSSGTYDEQYNAFYITGHITNSTGIDWGTPAQITNLNGSGQPNGGYFDQPGGPSTDEQGANPPESIWNPDYDSASADWQSFHYSFMETSNEQVTNSAGNQVTLEDQEDVYMANVPIPYNGTAPATPYGVTFTPNLADGGTVQWNTAPYQNLSNAYAHIEYSTDTQGWMDLAPSNPPLANAAAGYQAHIPNYSPGTTYYFRVRIQNGPNSQIQLNADASSGYSDPVKSWTGGVPVLDNVLYSLWGYINGRPQYRVTVAWPLGYDASDAVQMQYYDGNRWTTQFPNADGSTTTLGGGSGDTGWAESYIITDSISDPPAFEFSIFFQNSSGGRSAASNVLTAINASNLDVPSAPSINEPTSSDPSNPTNESGDVWVEWNGAPYDQSAIMDVVLTPINESGGGPSVQTYAAYGDADVSGLDSGVEYEIQIRVEKTEQYEGETITLTSDFSSPVYVIGM